MEQIDTIVIGAGVVGLAIARKMAMQGHDVVLLESEQLIGSGTSSRNSEVIHAGIYYPKNSLKARLCVEGKALLYDFCREYNIAHKNCQKLIVATEDQQLAKLEAIATKASDNGVTDLAELTAGQAIAMEPALRCKGALLSPSTGIVDSHGLMLALQGQAEDNGAMIAFNTNVERLVVTNKGIEVHTKGEADMCLLAQNVINAAGLSAPIIARKTDGLDKTHCPDYYVCKGNYFTLSGKSPFSRLIYPTPSEAGLGVHLTIDLAGQAKFGPDTEWLDHNFPTLADYPVNPSRGDSFYEAIRSYWPNLQDGSLVAGYSGMRPKLSGPEDAAADFKIDGPATHGIAGLVNLFGIESPGLTS
ncbi:MAG: NAD(P)/FAD-dependent oxidoreductase, partial [Alphaproteobacteria bacterium]|nr:NAD(P)/FAD-dependent oxidoreductase [Alphaproteobacteria bacterium]